MPKRYIMIHAKNSRGTGFPFSVPLPVDQWTRRRVVADAQELVGICISQADLDTFEKRLDYLPVTQDQLAEADRLHDIGFDWHTSCAKAKGLTNCPCPDCQDTTVTVSLGDPA